ncbi:uncharacterized protein LOC121856462 [Homarus americanus]|uniref:uncharacterized protein LOC121856462 n=1 Tax=Homarus americanus TaxID=6706 RepID=UPI001C43E4E2|nr:uncharacterized protein LOC121856462 [Homarus americanus]
MKRYNNPPIFQQFLKRRLQQGFNTRFDAVHQRKGRVIEEVHRLTRKRRQLKEELSRIRKRGDKSRGHSGSTSSRGASEGVPTPTLLQEEEKEEEEEEEEEEYEPSWELEERPELMLQVDDTEVTKEESNHSETPRAVPDGAVIAPSTAGAREAWTDARAFLSGPRHMGTENGEASSTTHFFQKPREVWTWAEARAWREWKAAQDEEARKRKAHATTLTLQLERIIPTIKSLLQEFDSQVISLVDSRVSTDEALLLYDLVTVRLRHRLAQQDHLNDTLKDLKQRRCQVEERVSQVVKEAEGSSREEARAKAKQERIQEQLKEEEVGLRRALINLPIDQYNHLLMLYSC